MQRAVIGAQVHSGWAALVAVAGEPHAANVIDRRRIEMIESAMAGAKQPYHFAENLQLADAQKHLDKCAAASERLASSAIGQMVLELRSRDYEVSRAAIVRAAGRPLPGLADILASHALIHTAEGEFFRMALRRAFDNQGLAVCGIRERDLEEQAAETFGTAAARMQERIAGLGRSLGPPWTRDQKAAALAASIVLANLCGHTYSKSPLASVD